jgi:hypothetical protein
MNEIDALSIVVVGGVDYIGRGSGSPSGSAGLNAAKTHCDGQMVLASRSSVAIGLWVID